MLNRKLSPYYQTYTPHTVIRHNTQILVAKQFPNIHTYSKKKKYIVFLKFKYCT